MKNYYLILFLLILAACSSERKPYGLERMNWVLGTWKMDSKEGVFIETWSKQNDTLILGSGYFIAGSDTPFREELSIIDRNDTLYYAAITPKNDKVPVFFKERSYNDKEIVFENPEHDFPQQISYRRISDRNIIAAITGTQDGKSKTETFNLAKQ